MSTHNTGTISRTGLSAMPESEYEVFGKTHIGKKRRVNQDTFLLDPKIGLFLVADGMGGHKAGDTASLLAAEGIRTCFENALQDMHNFLADDAYEENSSFAANVLKIALKRTNERVRAKGESAAEYHGMGSTLAAVCLSDRQITCANVGDSPIYLVQAGRVFPLFMPHTVEEEAHLPENPEGRRLARKYPGMLTRAIGGDKTVEPYICEIPVSRGDSFVLCTDGLSGTVGKNEIVRIVRTFSAKEACSALIDLANERGGADNITAVVLNIEKKKFHFLPKRWFPFQRRLKTDK
ncbi:MAG: protein phosphatase 2C domain-containing protein [Desulfarculaceae bacterium]|nr:protein phosphatase 2C domain-containing protein [Desulfarculaceae bacterium]